MIRHSEDVSVVICAYTQDRWDDLQSAVGSVLEQSRSAREIIVVIDHNPALFRRVCAEIFGVIAVENHELRGLSGARNCGIEVAGGSVVAFLDDDAVASPDWLEEIAAGYADPRVVGVGGLAAPMWAVGRPRWFPEEFDWVVGCSYRGMPRSSARVRNFLGCNMSFKKELLAANNGFRTSLGRVGTRPLGCEETEFCIRAIQARPGKILMHKPSARVAHRVPAMRTRWRYFLSRCYFEGQSKVQVKRFVGSKDGLASEWQYTLRTLPAGVMRGLTDTLFRADLAGVSRAAFIAVGFLSTALGYLAGQLTGLPSVPGQRRAGRAEESGR